MIGISMYICTQACWLIMKGMYVHLLNVQYSIYVPCSLHRMQNVTI